MKKLNELQSYLTRLRGLMLTLVILLTIGSGNAWSDTWTRVTSVDQITDGGTFIIGYEATAKSGVLVPLRAEGGTATTTTAGLIYSGTTSGSSSNGSIDMSTIIATTDYEVIIIAGASSGTISIKLSDNNYIGNDNTKNKVKLYSSVSANTSFTPTIGTNDVVTLTLGTISSTYSQLQYNKTSGQERFCCYNGGQQNLVLYKKGASVKYTVTWNDNGGQIKSEEIAKGSTSYSCPSAPSTSARGNCGDKFMGWTTTASYTGSTPPAVLFTDDSGTKPAINGNTDFYAVFADEE